MQKLLVIVAAVIGLTVATAFAHMDGSGGMGGQHPQQPGGMMGSQQSNQIMGGQMMSHDMMRDMAGMMKQMNEMMGKMSGLMEQKGSMNQGKIMDMSKMMGDMSANMKDMSEQMAMGKMDATHIKKMQERMKNMEHMMVTIEKEGK